MHRHIRHLAALLALTGWFVTGARAVEDGMGTNHVGLLRASGLELGGEVRTAWTPEAVSVGGTVDFRAQSNRVVWAPAFRWTGDLETVRLQTDGGNADVRIVRAKWNDAWDAYTVLLDIEATSAGVASDAFSSSWVSNQYRLGVIVTNYTTGTNLWWSVEGVRTGAP